ncbi:MAG: CapA family protein [Christensenellales bacterium]
MRRAVLILLTLFMLLSARAEGTEILLTFTGDCTLGSEERTRALPGSFDSYVFDYGYDYPFLRVQEILSADDVTVINLENVFYPYEANRVQKTYNFRGPTDFAEILRQGSVELCFLGNNHTGDYGHYGLKSTVETLEGAGLAWFGVPYPALRTWIYEKDGVRIGFTGSYIGYWSRDPQGLRDSFTRLKKADCDVIVALMHGGAEYAPRQGADQERFARFLVSCGADLVVGHHPHVLQGVDRVDGINIIYSLGNFSFGGNKELRATQTLLAQVRLSFGSDRRYLGQQLNLIPAHVSGTLAYNNYQPVLVSGQEAGAIIDQVAKYSGYPLAPYQEGIGALQDFLPAPSPSLLPRDPS